MMSQHVIGKTPKDSSDSDQEAIELHNSFECHRWHPSPSHTPTHFTPSYTLTSTHRAPEHPSADPPLSPQHPDKRQIATSTHHVDSQLRRDRRHHRHRRRRARPRYETSALIPHSAMLRTRLSTPHPASPLRIRTVLHHLAVAVSLHRKAFPPTNLPPFLLIAFGARRNRTTP